MIFQHYDEIPAPLDGEFSWIDGLRWMLAVCDDDDRTMGFLAGLLANACDHGGGLTEKQVAAARRILSNFLDRHSRDALDCQVILGAQYDESIYATNQKDRSVH